MASPTAFGGRPGSRCSLVRSNVWVAAETVSPPTAGSGPDNWTGGRWGPAGSGPRPRRRWAWGRRPMPVPPAGCQGTQEEETEQKRENASHGKLLSGEWGRKAGEVFRSGDAFCKRALPQVAVDLRLGGIVVGAHVEDAEDAQGKDIQKVPAQVAQLEDKDPPFVPIGHAETQLEGCLQGGWGSPPECRAQRSTQCPG